MGWEPTSATSKNQGAGNDGNFITERTMLINTSKTKTMVTGKEDKRIDEWKSNRKG